MMICKYQALHESDYVETLKELLNGNNKKSGKWKISRRLAERLEGKFCSATFVFETLNSNKTIYFVQVMQQH